LLTAIEKIDKLNEVKSKLTVVQAYLNDVIENDETFLHENNGIRISFIVKNTLIKTRKALELIDMKIDLAGKKRTY
jgi:hypothetical protein